MSSSKPKNRTFWSKHREELDRIGWTGKYIFSDSEEDDKKDTSSETDDEEDYSTSEGTSNIDSTLSSVTAGPNIRDQGYRYDYEDYYYLDDRESDGYGSGNEYYQHISWGEYWSCVQYASEDNDDDGDGDWQHITTPAQPAIQESYEDGFVLGYILGFVTSITAEVGVFCFLRRLYD